MGRHPAFLLGSWLNDSHSGAAHPKDAANLEYGARNLLTLWGGDVGSDLSGYDGKVWSGLLKDVYARVWALLLDAMVAQRVRGVAMNPAAIEKAQFDLVTQWVHANNTYPAMANGSGVRDAAAAVVDRYAPGPATLAKRFRRIANKTVNGFVLMRAQVRDSEPYPNPNL